MTITKCLFIDVDGPMIPVRAYWLTIHLESPGVASWFDPCATGMLKHLLDESGAKIVISSTWGGHGRKKCDDLFRKNGIDPDIYFHPHWVTPRKMSSSRSNEIKWWLDDHPEITHWAAVDDEILDDSIANAVVCDAYEGFSFYNLLECKLHLGIERGEKTTTQQQDEITYFKKRLIWRLKPGSPEARKAADIVFPPTPPNKDE